MGTPFHCRRATARCSADCPWTRKMVLSSAVDEAPWLFRDGQGSRTVASGELLATLVGIVGCQLFAVPGNTHKGRCVFTAATDNKGTAFVIRRCFSTKLRRRLAELRMGRTTQTHNHAKPSLEALSYFFYCSATLLMKRTEPKRQEAKVARRALQEELLEVYLKMDSLPREPLLVVPVEATRAEPFLAPLRRVRAAHQDQNWPTSSKVQFRAMCRCMMCDCETRSNEFQEPQGGFARACGYFSFLSPRLWWR
eukprot:6087962-Amphidinium_carterae.1